MKELLIVVSVVLSGVACEAPAPYPPSGWKPNGPAFELPAKPQQQYLPVDPRLPRPNNFDDTVDVSVQGLPTVEQQQIFEVSPINGQQYTGPSVNSDIKKLDPTFQQAQYQLQLEKARQFARQREYDARVNSSPNGLPNQKSPRQFAYQTTTSTKPSFKPPQEETTTEPLELNEGEELEEGNDRDVKARKEKVSVEVTKQNIQEYPAEIFLSPLTQFKIQPQFAPFQQLAQLQSPVIYQIQASPASQGFNGPAHLAALPSVLSQRELLSQQIKQNQFASNPIIVQQEPIVQPLNQYQPINQISQQSYPLEPIVQQQPLNQYQPLNSNPLQAYPQQPITQQPLNQLQPINQIPQQPYPQQEVVTQQYQPVNQFQPQTQVYPQIQTQQVIPQQNVNQIQPNQFQPNQQDVEQIQQNDQPQVYQYQPQFIQYPQPNYQTADPYNQQAQFFNQQSPNYQIQDGQYYQNVNQYNPQQVVQGQGLQSGLDLNQQGNSIDEPEERDTERDDEGSTATAVATAFGTRTQPRVLYQYAPPTPTPGQANPLYTTTTEASTQEETTEVAPTVAEATAVATGRRNAKLRSRRIRPVFTLDRSGHLVLAQQ